jgi:hypothetical protein
MSCSSFGYREGVIMRKIFTLFACSAMFSAFAFAANWDGALVDEPCFDRQNKELKDVARAADACEASPQSATFAFISGGKIYRFDSAGHAKAAAALKNRADRTAPGQKLARIMVTVSGEESGGTIKVDRVEVP